MTTTQIDTRVTSRTTAPVVERTTVWKHGLAATSAAAVATTALAAAASAAGVSFADSTGESIPVSGFTTLTIFFSLVGVAIAAVMARKARTPRRAFVRTTVALTVLSYVPDVLVGFSAGSAVTLMALHTVAAAIVIPVLAGRLATSR